MAATLINDGETIILDSGTTTLEIARQIKNKQGLQILTNGVNVAVELLDARGVQTFIAGGTVRGDSASIVGRSTEEMFDQFAADKLFLSAAGCDPDFGVSGANLEETMVNRAMLRIAREVILVSDATKFSRAQHVTDYHLYRNRHGDKRRQPAASASAENQIFRLQTYSRVRETCCVHQT